MAQEGPKMTKSIAVTSPLQTGIFSQLLPPRIDNTYRGQKLALWFFALFLLMKIAMSLNFIFNGYTVATSADGIPVGTFTPAGAQTVVALFAIWGLAHFILCLLGILALVRYRAMIAFMFALFLLEQLSRKLIFHFLPIGTAATPTSFYVNLMLFTLMIIGLALALWSHGNVQAQG
jgi:hypothetical protein